jgi:hypothetical protein
MKKTFIIFFSTLIISCDNSSSSIVPKSPEELKMELKIQEQNNPLLYLSSDNATMKRNLVKEEGLFRDAEYDGYLIEGTIKNSASVARFKDVVLTVQFYSQTGTVIEEKDFVLYEFYEPNATRNFTLKLYPPEAMDKFGVEIKGATPDE